jgi:hypothetical protein
MARQAGLTHSSYIHTWAPTCSAGQSKKRKERRQRKSEGANKRKKEDIISVPQVQQCIHIQRAGTEFGVSAILLHTWEAEKLSCEN